MTYDGRIELTIENEIFMRVHTEYGIMYEMEEMLSFMAPGYQFHPKFKNRMWDGKIRPFTARRPYLQTGFIEKIKEFAEFRNYELIYDRNDFYPDMEVTLEDIKDLSKEIGANLEARDYQLKYIMNALNKNRSISLSPTSSGKSFIQYLIARYYNETFGHRCLMIVPNIGLVNQMFSDFIEYGCDPDLIYKIKGGVDKNTDKQIVISTWQSLIKQPKEWFTKFRVVMGDEVHLFAAKSLVSIIEKCENSKYRHGFSGTIPEDSKIHETTLEGLFGKSVKYISTSELIEQGYASTLKVKGLVLEYPKEVKKEFNTLLKKIDTKKKYKAEKEFIANYHRRNKFIANLAQSQKGKNNLILFDMIEKHGKIIEKYFDDPEWQLHFIYGGTDGDTRENLRKLIDNDTKKNHNILASYGVFSTGVNIKKIDNVIFASGYKSEVKVLQSIGRSLRKTDGSEHAVLYDIADNLGNTSNPNYSIQHFKRRLEIYAREEFPFNIYHVDI